METQLFHFRDFIREDEVFHLARVTIYSRRDISLHRHDFAEMFWVESGNGTHLINGKEIKLERGDIVMIRPGDQHTFTSSKKGLTIMNIAFSLATLDHLRARYFPGIQHYFWWEEFLPFTTSVDLSLIRQISRRAEACFQFRNSFLHLDSFLLFVFRSIVSNEGMIVKDKQIPLWLHNAMQDFCTPGLFKQGYSGFVDICGKNIDHINRTVKKTLNKSLSDLIAELRMSYAAKQLIITNVPIKTICSDCGFNSLAHFYKTFRKVYQVTPYDYRQINQNVA